MSLRKKTLVIGAGIAGTAACYWLKKFGFSPTLIEKSPELRVGGQPLDIRGVATKLVRKMGIYEKICERRTRLECGRFVDQQGNLLHEERGEKFGFRQNDEIEIARGDLVEILHSLIPEVPRVFGQSVAEINQNREGVTVSFKDGKEEQFGIVIGADGIYSTTRRLVFEKDAYELVGLGPYLCTFTIPNYLKLSHSETECEANYKMMTLNSDLDPQVARAAFMFRSQETLKNPRDESEQKEFMRSAFSNFGWEAKRVLELMPMSQDFYFDGMNQIKMNSWTQGRIALVGDAGYCASPLSGQGNNLAVIGAYILAGELRNSDGNYQKAFSSYNQLMRPLVDSTQDFARWINSIYLVEENVSKEIAEERTAEILRRIKSVSHAISLPEYV